MTTLATLKSAIADDLARSDLTSQIASAITQAIDFYKGERFWWNETRDSTFATVASQSRYDSDDDSDIPLFIEVDDVFLTDSNSQVHLLDWRDPSAMEASLDATASSGRPYAYSYFGEAFWFYPIPDAAYTIRPLGLIEVAAPASDSEAGNRWMTEAFELIRCTAKASLYVHVIKDVDKAATFTLAAEREIRRLRRDTARRITSGHILATSF